MQVRKADDEIEFNYRTRREKDGLRDESVEVSDDEVQESDIEVGSLDSGIEQSTDRIMDDIGSPSSTAARTLPIGRSILRWPAQSCRVISSKVTRCYAACR